MVPKSEGANHTDRFVDLEIGNEPRSWQEWKSVLWMERALVPVWDFHGISGHSYMVEILSRTHLLCFAASGMLLLSAVVTTLLC